MAQELQMLPDGPFLKAAYAALRITEWDEGQRAYPSVAVEITYRQAAHPQEHKVEKPASLRVVGGPAVLAH